MNTIMKPTPALVAWDDLVCGHKGQGDLNDPFSGALETSGVYAISGPNGSGKSTLLRTWLGLQAPRSGRVTLLGCTPARAHSVSEGISYVPQSHKVNQFFHLTVSDFIRQGFGPRAATVAEERRVSELLEKWQLEADANRSFHVLSGGQKTRAMVARATASIPRILFLDEPLASLDSCCQQLLMDGLHELAHPKTGTGVCVVMVDHHFGPFERHLSGRMEFHRGHDREVCSVTFESLTPTCCPA